MQGAEKLFYFLDKCTRTLEYKEKNINVYLNGFLEINGEKYLKWVKTFDDWAISSKYKVVRDRLIEILSVDGNKVIFNKEYLKGKEFTEVIKTVNELKEIISIIEKLEKNNEKNINIINSKSKGLLNEEFVIDKYKMTQSMKLLKEQVMKRIYENYQSEYVKKHFTNKNSGIEKCTFERMVEIYNEIISSKVLGARLVDPTDSDYIIAKELCYNVEQNSYFTNIKLDEVLEVGDFKIVELNDYIQYIKCVGEVNLLDNSDKNIAIIFSDVYLSGEKYMISTKAYFDALQKIKAGRGKKKCWVCGDKLGLFNFDITCTKHKKYEDSEYL